MSSEITYYRTTERPDIRLWLTENGSLPDFSSGYTFVFKIGHPGSAAVFTKSSGIAGAAGSGTEPTGTPNCVVTLSAGDMDSPEAGDYTWQIRATTTGSVDRVFQGPFRLRDIIS